MAAAGLLRYTSRRVWRSDADVPTRPIVKACKCSARSGVRSSKHCAARCRKLSACDSDSRPACENFCAAGPVIGVRCPLAAACARGSIGSGGRRRPCCEGPSPPPRGARGPDEADRQRNGGRAGEPVGVDREFTAAGAAVSHLVYKEGGSCYSVGKAGLQ